MACVSCDTHFGPARKILQVTEFENPVVDKARRRHLNHQAR